MAGRYVVDSIFKSKTTIIIVYQMINYVHVDLLYLDLHLYIYVCLFINQVLKMAIKYPAC